MSEPKFTPGPWEHSEAGDYSDFDGASIVILGDDRRIAAVHCSGSEGEANAHLIAASPDLYHALTKAREFIRHLTSREDHLGDMAKDAAIAADAALAKAIGKAGQ
jgi:hypothetical protein